jgi:hypothetical protein
VRIGECELVNPSSGPVCPTKVAPAFRTPRLRRRCS